MNSRQTRNRRDFRLESLEVRNAPSHFGALAHTAVVLHQVHAAAQVRHLHNPQGSSQDQSREKNFGAVKSPDNGSETTTDKLLDNGSETASEKPSSSDLTGNDPSSNDPNSVDPKGDR